MKFKELDTVVLDRDLPNHGLRTGDLGAVVHVHEADALEVEFVTASGRTQALVTLTLADVRPVRDEDVIAVRPGARGAASGSRVQSWRRKPLASALQPAPAPHGVRSPD